MHVIFYMHFVYEQNPHRLVFGTETSKTAAFNRCVKNKYICITSESGQLTRSLNNAWR